MSVICDAHKKKVGVELLYNSVHRKFDQLEKRCSREKQLAAEGALRTPDWAVGDQTSWREDAGMRNMSQRGWAPRPPVEQPRRTGKKCYYGHKSGGQYAAVLFSLQPSHSKTFSSPFEPFQIKWEVYFSKELCRSSLLCGRYDSACICVCIVGHGYTTISWMRLFVFHIMQMGKAWINQFSIQLGVNMRAVWFLYLMAY